MIMTPHGQSDWYHGKRTETLVKLTPVEIHWACPKCKRGEMVFNGYTWTVHPNNGNHHECTKCKWLCAIESARYPRVEYINNEPVKKEVKRAPPRRRVSKTANRSKNGGGRL